MKEIGSEFCDTTTFNNTDNNLDFINIGTDNKLFMSGRTAIDYIIKNINESKRIVYMPDYLCESMVEPFKNNGYIIKYYEVDIKNNKYLIDVDTDCTIFFAMSYFGYNCSNMDNYTEIFSKKKITKP